MQNKTLFSKMFSQIHSFLYFDFVHQSVQHPYVPPGISVVAIYQSPLKLCIGYNAHSEGWLAMSGTVIGVAVQPSP